MNFSNPAFSINPTNAIVELQNLRTVSISDKAPSHNISPSLDTRDPVLKRSYYFEFLLTASLTSINCLRHRWVVVSDGFRPLSGKLFNLSIFELGVYTCWVGVQNWFAFGSRGPEKLENSGKRIKTKSTSNFMFGKCSRWPNIGPPSGQILTENCIDFNHYVEYWSLKQFQAWRIYCLYIYSIYGRVELILASGDHLCIYTPFDYASGGRDMHRLMLCFSATEKFHTPAKHLRDIAWSYTMTS